MIRKLLIFWFKDHEWSLTGEYESSKNKDSTYHKCSCLNSEVRLQYGYRNDNDVLVYKWDYLIKCKHDTIMDDSNKERFCFLNKVGKCCHVKFNGNVLNLNDPNFFEKLENFIDHMCLHEQVV